MKTLRYSGDAVWSFSGFAVHLHNIFLEKMLSDALGKVFGAMISEELFNYILSHNELDERVDEIQIREIDIVKDSIVSLEQSILKEQDVDEKAYLEKDLEDTKARLITYMQDLTNLREKIASLRKSKGITLS